jgi:N-acetylglucosamine-6-phosphate deacetylase
MAKKVNLVVDQKEDAPVDRHVLAGAIVEMSKGLRSLTQRGGLTLEAVIVLTQHRCKSPYKFGAKPSMGEVRAVFEALSQLEQAFVQK